LHAHQVPLVLAHIISLPRRSDQVLQSSTIECADKAIIFCM